MPPTPAVTPVSDRHHVQFYRDQAALVTRLTSLVHDGLRSRCGILVLAHPDKLAILRQALATDPVCVSAIADGQIRLLDARLAMESIFIDGAIDAAGFRAVLGTVVEELLQRFGHVSGYGELVDLLWERGHRDATLSLEPMWHEFLATRPVSLLCGYCFSGFSGDDERAFLDICDAHGDVHAHGGPAPGDTDRLLATFERRGLELSGERQRRRDAEQALERSEEFNRRIIDSSGDCIKVLGLDGRMLSMNEGGLRAMGLCDVATIIGEPYVGFWAGEEALAAGRALDEARAGRPGRFQGCCPTASGEKRWWDVLVTPIMAADGHPERLLAVSRDITHHHEQAERLRKTEERLAAALAAAHVGTWQWDIVADRITWDPSLRRVVGLSDDEPLPTGQAFAEWIHPDDRERTGNAIADALSGKRDYDVEFRLRHADGSMHWHHSRGTVRRSDGRPVEMIGACVDITDLRQAQEAMAATATELKRSNQELEQFAFVASHDLQEPVRMIISFLSLFQRRMEGAMDAKSRDYLEQVTSAADRMRRMVAGVLNYARVGNELSRSEVNLVSAAEESVAALRTQIEQVRAAITIGPLPCVLGDHGLMVQVFQNLIANALKFRGDADPTIAVQATETIAEVIISVRDNGIGIKAGDLDRLFKLFQRLNAREAFAGEGIGLATCKRILDRHGGRIWATPNPDRGTTFSFSLPLKQAPLSPSRLPDGGKQILAMIDDNRGDIELVSEVFAASHPHILVRGYACGEDFIQALAQTESGDYPAAVLLDLNMPRMDGRAVLSFVKNHAEYRRLPVLMYSSSARQADRQQCLNLGADDYVVKPSHIDECAPLIERIVQLLQTTRAQVAST